MTKADFSSPRRLRLGVIVAVTLLHVAAFFALIRAFAPGFVDSVVENVTTVLTVTVTTPTPTPKPEPKPVPKEQGAAAEAGKKAKPKEVSAPKVKIPVAKTPAPPVSSTGDDTRSGATNAGTGTGAGGAGLGTGAGSGGSGQGGGMATKAVKIAGDINSARDYPRDSRDRRIGSQVTVVLTVGVDGRVKNCRIHRPSSDPEADRITCRLARERFRFRPAMDFAGKPIQSVYGWQQRWFYNDRR